MSGYGARGRISRAKRKRAGSARLSRDRFGAMAFPRGWDASRPRIKREAVCGGKKPASVLLRPRDQDFPLSPSPCRPGQWGTTGPPTDERTPRVKNQTRHSRRSSWIVADRPGGDRQIRKDLRLTVSRDDVAAAEATGTKLRPNRSARFLRVQAAASKVPSSRRASCASIKPRAAARKRTPFCEHIRPVGWK